MKTKELKKAFEEKLITEEKYKQELFKIATEKSPKFKKDKKLPVSITEEEFVALIKATKKEEYRLAFLLGFGSGMRISEVVSVKPEHFDRTKNSILIVQGKGGKDRIVPIPKGFKEKYLTYLPLVKEYTNVKSAIRAVQKGFQRTAQRAEITKTKPSIHFHSLRHGFATRFLANGGSLHHLRTLLGHTNISVTNSYLEMNPKDALKEYEKVF